jgi:hypothetical protein
MVSVRIKLMIVERAPQARHGDAAASQMLSSRAAMLCLRLADRTMDAGVGQGAGYSGGAHSERLETPVGEGVQQSVAADNPSWPGDEHPQYSELASCEGIGSPDSRASRQASKLRTSPAKRRTDAGSREGLTPSNPAVSRMSARLSERAIITLHLGFYKKFTGRTSSVYTTFPSALGSRPWTAIVAAQLEKEEGP